MQQLPKLSKQCFKRLSSSRNLLAFSAGSDSSALFFILNAYGIEFDIAIVDYQTRAQSQQEVARARELAVKYHKKCFVHTCALQGANFEHNARIQRYAFFGQLTQEHSYTTLLTAHHLGDKLEWFLMQLTRGAGLVELLGMREFEQRESYDICRPLLHVSKDELQDFLRANQIKYFMDDSNTDTKYTRNKMRSEYATPLLKAYTNGIKKSFAYLAKDASTLLPHVAKRNKKLSILERSDDVVQNTRGIDKICKELGYLLSAAQREQIALEHDSVAGGIIAIAFTKKHIYICPHSKVVMDKKFKEACRVAKIPAKIRPYMYESGLDPTALH